MRLVFLVGLLLLCVHFEVNCTWKFTYVHRYISPVQLKQNTTTLAIPMVYDDARKQLLRVIPRNSAQIKPILLSSLKKSKGKFSDSTMAPFISSAALSELLANENILQRFDSKLKLISYESVAPEDARLSNMQIFYKGPKPKGTCEVCLKESSTSETSSLNCRHHQRSCSKSCSRSELINSFKVRSYVVFSTNWRSQNYLSSCPRMILKCVFSSLNSYLKQITGPSGNTYFLYSNYLVVLNDRCEEIRRINDFGESTIFAKDFVVDEIKGILVIAFTGLFCIFYDNENFQKLQSLYPFSVPVVLTEFYLTPSAMTWCFQEEPLVTFTFRCVILDGNFAGVWIIYYYFSVMNQTFLTETLFLTTKPGLSILQKTTNYLLVKEKKSPKITEHKFLETSEVQSSKSDIVHQKAQLALQELCLSVSTTPAIIADYKHELDISVGFLTIGTQKVLHFYTTKFRGGSSQVDQVERTCYNLVLPSYIAIQDQSIGYLFTGKSEMGLNRIFLTLVPSLDILVIDYEYIHNEVQL